MSVFGKTYGVTGWRLGYAAALGVVAAMVPWGVIWEMPVPTDPTGPVPVKATPGASALEPSPSPGASEPLPPPGASEPELSPGASAITVSPGASDWFPVLELSVTLSASVPAASEPNSEYFDDYLGS
jgi:hypothetical protein